MVASEWSGVLLAMHGDAPRSKLKLCLARPNFIMILMDDAGWGDWSLTGVGLGSSWGSMRIGSPALTPHLEEMANSSAAVGTC